MYDTYGKLSLEGLNAKAEELLNSGDVDGMYELARENMLESLADMYNEGETDYLCEDVMDAAMARLDLEADDLGAEELMGDWVDYLRSLVMENEDFAEKIMNPEKSLKGCVGVLAAWSITHAEPLDPDIIKAMDKAVTDTQLKKLKMQRSWIQYTKIGMPGMGTAKKLIREYYGEG